INNECALSVQRRLYCQLKITAMREKSKLSGYLLLILIFSFSSERLFSQVTTATLVGFVHDSKGAPLSPATVIIELPDAGIRQAVLTKGDGRFTVPNLRVGGPYRITVTM